MSERSGLLFRAIVALTIIGNAYVPVSAAPPEFPAFIREYLRGSAPDQGRQLLIAAARRPGDIRIVLYNLERSSPTGDWRLAFPPMPATIGYRGFAPVGKKTEGDGRSPSGRFAAGFAFGYGPGRSLKTRMPYRQITARHFWNTDPASSYYNSWREGRIGRGSSYEHMRRRDQQYSLGLVIRYNMNPVIPGRGSAIFLHIWRGPGKSTAGCIGVSEIHMQQILGWLDPGFEPMIVMGTTAEIRSGRVRQGSN